ncbi:protein of unknown function DUF214 [Beutenbergia cavernae DSM 12333]|uniref:ABC3 transporter permease protein domain-containing protein n=1 Tax=Beutenbergia cavernae (strain ATCC BAA-8 / DSM 12333 / CCUG 43141 / JCM 11478 / NBRC 16432 / NCIMB 13614 / HKI 0122) TaxID=471853 RepID=C5BYH0_BEUC1|nr:ABC transporter permease [Beutenbergia cavernae]ACQ81070.1 protein of unknown function DUF214 [Beutenbergia cavernae DSM 12333]
MGRLTWAQMRRTAPRLVAVGIAIMLGAAFIAAMLLSSATMRRVGFDAATASLGDPDLVVVADQESLTQADLDALAALDDVAAIEPRREMYVDVGGSGRSEGVLATPVASHPRLAGYTIEQGEVPTGAGQVALPAATADRLDVGIGDDVTLTLRVWTPDGEGVPERSDAQVVGIAADGTGFGYGTPTALVDPAQLDAWASAADEEPSFVQVSLLLTDGADVEQARAAIADALPAGDVRTRDEHAAALARDLTGDEDVLSMLVLPFGAVALFVAGLVIANTFTVLVAQRTHTLALLRCVGATRAQLRRSVLQEAAVVGAIASAVGVLLGIGLGQVTLTLLRAADLDVPLPATVTLTPWVVAVPLVVCTLVTLVAATGPARLATRVPPLAAMRPVELTQARGAGRLRLVAGWAFAAAGGLLMVGALAGGETIGYELSLAVGVAGGAISILGFILLTTWIVPAGLRALGRLATRVAGVPGALAATNARRNPRRSATTATALLIGVTLVTMMATGAAMTRAQMGETLSDRYPVDVSIGSDPDTEVGLPIEEAPLSDAQIEAVAGVDGVAHVAPLTGVVVTAVGASGDGVELAVRGIAPGDLDGAVRDSPAAELDAGTVLVPQGWLADLGVAGGDELTLEGAGGEATLRVVVADSAGAVPLVTPDVLDELQPGAAVNRLWVRIADGADVRTVTGDLSDALVAVSSDADASPVVSGNAVERVGFEQVVDTLLAVVVGLLAVAVVIALVGVANTLALSVIERRRENALLRALGLTRRQLRGTLAVEGFLLAFVGALVGVALGLGYGWIGGVLLLRFGGTADLVVPWAHIGAVLAIAAVAGVVASVLPGRSAARVSPVAALAAD